MAQHNRLDNRGEIEGNLGQNPDIGVTSEGKPYARLSIGNTNRWTDKTTGETKEYTHWFNVVFWNENLIEKVIRQYLFKGSKVRVEYSLRTNKWNTNFVNPDGTAFAPTVIELVGNELKLCDTKDVSDKRRAAAQPQQAAAQSQQAAAQSQQAAAQSQQAEPEYMDEGLY